MTNQNNIQNALQRPYDLHLFATHVLNPVFSNNFQMQQLTPATVEPTRTEGKSIAEVFTYGIINLDDDTEIICYEINLQHKVKIEQSKIAIQHYARRLLTAGQAALINFVNPDNKDLWRFTFIAKDSAFTEKGISEKATNAKRYTYLLGTSESCKTAAQRFEILANQTSLTLETLTNAFSVEKLSKDFFDEYLQHYNNFVEYLTNSNFRQSVFNANDKAVRDFTKKMLGRIVFLYFVQKKGWLGASDLNYTDGLPDFMMNFFLLSGANETFYENNLKNLFFDTLNKERPNDDFEMPDGKMLKVPFLNGGLFDKTKYDNGILTFKPDLFHNNLNEDDPKHRGFLDFLNAYNFTIYEDSPDEQTVAVDPEMLGHIFENLLEDNKDKGAYYTPKEIVHYMCQESLSEYLKTHTGENENIEQLVKHKEISDISEKKLQNIDNLLDTVKICDPAIGSGAFPMGLLQEIYNIKEVISYHTKSDWKPAEVKENIIQNSIYGVDIEKGAVDIARLRFWLSLVVDEEKPKPLPNLDYKIVIGNSLVSIFENEVIEIDWKLANNSALKQSRPDLYKRINQNINDIYKAQHDFFHSVSDKNKIKLKIRNLKIELLETLINIEKQKLFESGIDISYATKKKQKIEITQRKIKYEGFNKMLSKLQTLKKQPDKPLNYFNWELNFPEVLSENLLQNKTKSPEIVVLNKQIDALNVQIDAINKAIENRSGIKLIKLKLVSAQSQINATEFELSNIEKHISKIQGDISYMDKKIVSEPTSLDYQISSINKNIEEINNRIIEVNKKLFSKVEKLIGFDIVIGNPPYIKEYTNKDAFNGFRNSKYYQGKMDIWYGFACHGIDMTKLKSGILSFIATNNWTTNSGASLMRKRIAENAQILNILDFNNYKIFENAGIQTMIMIFRNDRVSKYEFDYRKITNNKPDYSHVLDLLNKVSTEDNQIFYYPFNIDNFKEKPLTFNPREIELILQQIKNEGKIYLTTKEVANGIHPHHDFVNKKMQIVLGNNFQVGDGIFGLSTFEKDSLNLTEKEQELIKPYYSTKNFSKYYGNPVNTEWIIYTGSEFKRKEAIKPYPNIKAHLDKFQKVITSDNKPYGLHRTRVESFFKGEKIIVQRKCPNEPIFTYTDFDAYVSATFYVIKTSRVNQKYLTTLLNSKLIAFWLKFRGKMQGNNYQLDKEPLINIPIKNIDKIKPYERIVDKILTLKKSGKDTTDLEREIDQMVYKLYGLTNEEIKIVEESIKK